MSLNDTRWGRLEPGHHTRNLHGFVLSVYREEVPGHRVEWCATIDGKQFGAWTRTLRKAKASAEAEAGLALSRADGEI